MQPPTSQLAEVPQLVVTVTTQRLPICQEPLVRQAQRQHARVGVLGGESRRATPGDAGGEFQDGNAGSVTGQRDEGIGGEVHHGNTSSGAVTWRGGPGTKHPARGGPPVIGRGGRPQARGRRGVGRPVGIDPTAEAGWVHGREPAIVPVGDLSNYAKVEIDNDGNAILPC